jgi:simple sugar transport system ATP-binding protein
MTTALVEMRNIAKHFGSVIALSGVSVRFLPGEVHCLLGDNGAGKSTFIKIMSGVFRPSSGEILIDGKVRQFQSPRGALDAGIATVFQDLAMIPLMSITRNFFMGREPEVGFGPLRRINFEECDRVTREQMADIGIDVRDPGQAVGTLSGGERQCVAIARAVYFGAKVLILDEPTSALGVRQTSMVLRYIDVVRQRGMAVVFITHNVRHAIALGNRFTVLSRGSTLGTALRGEITAEDLQDLMAGGRELAEISSALGGTV